MPKLFRPKNAALIEMKGPDARDFLHRLTTVQVSAMKSGDAAPGFFLNAQGKVKAAFWLACLSDQAFLIEIDGGPENAGDAWKKACLAAIDQMTFAEKFALKDMSETSQCAWLLYDEGEAHPSSALSAMVKDGLAWIHHGHTQFGRNWVSVWGENEALSKLIVESAWDAVTADELERLRVLAVRPAVGRELDFDVNPLEIGLKDAIADGKGCYPGQEVIEKIVALGSPARRLALLQGEGARPEPGTPVMNDGSSDVGVVTSSAEIGAGGFVALAIVKKIFAKEGNSVRIGESGLHARIERLAPYA